MVTSLSDECVSIRRYLPLSSAKEASKAVPAEAPTRSAGQVRKIPIEYDDVRHPTDLSIDDVVHPLVEVSSVCAVARRAVKWRDMTAEAIECSGSGVVNYRFQGAAHLLVVYERCERVSGESFVEGLPPSAFRSLSQRMTFVPAGCEYRERQESDAFTRIIFFYFDPARLTRRQIEEAALTPRLFFEDKALWHTAVRLNCMTRNVASVDRLYFKALGIVLIHDLATRNVVGPVRQATLRGGLAGWQQRAVAAYIEENLAKRIMLSTLAKLARLSPHHFCRAFKQSFGTPPHRYQNERRVEHAKALLAKPRPSMTDIAMVLGFSSSSSFTTTFRKITGLTPTAYTRSLPSPGAASARLCLRL